MDPLLPDVHPTPLSGPSRPSQSTLCHKAPSHAICSTRGGVYLPTLLSVFILERLLSLLRWEWPKKQWTRKVWMDQLGGCRKEVMVAWSGSRDTVENTAWMWKEFPKSTQQVLLRDWMRRCGRLVADTALILHPAASPSPFNFEAFSASVSGLDHVPGSGQENEGKVWLRYLHVYDSGSLAFPCDSIISTRTCPRWPAGARRTHGASFQLPC